ncbi:hypothetical protein CRE_31597 [Caenorhabditis remanei]|uniref:Uncharacterized protein n=1 Tax=Caenorhabditis remanei TaxID=31234 RepID=E3NQR4_CAERE|nr:hypothetical protein CRE_31597 [Caenorhabditis remanei]
MGLCCTEKYLKKSEISPTTVNIPSPWVADKKEKHFFVDRSSPSKFFKYPTGNNKSFLHPANVSSFFK